jgi:hypothetical protein
MLITLGSLVEIDYMGIYGFGLLKLLERVAAGPAVSNTPPPGGSAI